MIGGIEYGRGVYRDMITVFKHQKGCHVEDRAEFFRVVPEDTTMGLKYGNYIMGKWISVGYQEKFPNGKSFSTMEETAWGKTLDTL